MRPFPHFLTGDANAPTFGVELDLDHARSYVAQMIDQFIAGNPHFRFEDRIRQDFEELQIIAANLEAANAPEAIANPLRTYIIDIQRVLEAFAAEHGAWAATASPPRRLRSPAV